MAVVVVVAVVAGVWDGLGHSLFLHWLVPVLQALLSQVDRVPPVMMGLVWDPAPSLQLPHIPESRPPAAPPSTQESRPRAPSSLRPPLLEA